MYIFICRYIYMYTHTNTRTHTRTHTHTYKTYRTNIKVTYTYIYTTHKKRPVGAHETSACSRMTMTSLRTRTAARSERVARAPPPLSACTDACPASTIWLVKWRHTNDTTSTREHAQSLFESASSASMLLPGVMTPMASATKSNAGTPLTYETGVKRDVYTSKETYKRDLFTLKKTCIHEKRLTQKSYTRDL